MVEKILVGIDGSERSMNALRYAVAEAKDKGLEKVTVVNSIQEPEPDSDKVKEREDVLKDAESVGDSDVEIDTHLLVKGNAPDVDIVKFAEENDFNHIIVGDIGASGIARVVLGSVAEGVIRKAHCTVTLVKEVSPDI